MNKLFIYRPITEDPLYNCSAADKSLQDKLKGEPHIFWGAIGMTYGFFVQIIYILSLIVIRKEQNYVNPCYKIMFFLGISDLFAVFICCQVTGILLITGQNFCDSPIIVYTAGALGLGLWYFNSITCLLLVTQRLLTVSNAKKNILNFLFGGYKTPLLLLASFIYACIGAIFSTTPIFNTRLGMAFWDPLIYENKKHLYQNNFHIFNNYVVVVTSCTLYGLFCIKLTKSLKSNFNDSAIYSRLQNQIFVQSTLLCIFNFFSAIFYIFANLIEFREGLGFVIELMYQISTGIPAFVYLFLNHTVRRGVLALIYKSRLTSSNGVDAKYIKQFQPIITKGTSSSL